MAGITNTTIIVRHKSSRHSRYSSKGSSYSRGSSRGSIDISSVMNSCLSKRKKLLNFKMIIGKKIITMFDI